MLRFQGPRLSRCWLAVLDGSLTKAQYFTCEALTCSIGDHLLNGSLSVSDRASWTRGESCAVTCAEEYQAANEIRGPLTCKCDEAAGDAVLEAAVSKRLSVVCSLDDPATGVRHECRDLSCEGSSEATGKEGYEAGWEYLNNFCANCLVVGFADVLF